MAAPMRITDITSGLLGGEDGRVYIYNGKQTTLGDMTGKCKSWISPCPEEKVKCCIKFLPYWERITTC
jgi:glycosylphosphatidylinositol phospholipase D